MKKLSKEAKALKEVIHTTDSEKRVVVYHAVAEVVANELLGKSRMEQREIGVRVIDYINEIAIIDTKLMQNILTTTVKYKMSKSENSNLRNDIHSFSSFNDVLGIGFYYSKATIESIDKNFQLYRSAMLAALGIKSEVQSSFE